jgi:hypothetical protein
MHVANICFRCFIRMLQVFHLDVAYICNSCQVFFTCFCKCLRRLFQVFHMSSFVCAIVAFECFKSRSGVAYGKSVESGWRCGRCSVQCGQLPAWRGPATGAVARGADTVRC